MEHTAEKGKFSVVIQIVKAQLKGKTPHDRRIEILHKVGRPDHNAVEVFHLVQKLIDLRNFSTAVGSVAALHQAVDLVQKQDGVFGFGLSKRRLYVVFGSAHIH